MIVLGSGLESKLIPYLDWAVAQCVGLNTGIGGFVTRGLGYTIDYSNRLQEQRLHAEEAWRKSKYIFILRPCATLMSSRW